MSETTAPKVDGSGKRDKSAVTPFSLHKKRLAERIRKLFDGKIDVSKVKDTEREACFDQRGLAAYTLCALGVADPDSAARSLVDGGNDGGIDAIFIDGSSRPTVYLVQSKWPAKTSKGIDEASALKLMRGVSAILRDEWDMFNDKVLAMKSTLQEATLNADAHFVVVITAPSENLLADHARKAIDDGLAEINGDLEPIVTAEQFDLRRLYRSLTAADGASAIDLKITLREWGIVKSPYSAFYGQVSVGDIVAWREHGSQLFARNLRAFQGQKSDVYPSIAKTLTEEPDHFWYFNNGATLLCASVSKLPLYGDKREEGIFECKGVSVVNGAQTIGSVWDSSQSGKDLSPTTRMPVRIISLEGCPEGFANAVTRATNTQNRIGARDFAALDPNQARLAVEMTLAGRTYAFRTGDKVEPESGCDIREATAALACTQGLHLAVRAKREVGALWANIDSAPYTDIFNDSLSAEKLWRAVLISRSVDAALTETGRGPGLFRGSLIARHGNRFILYRVFQDPMLSGFADGSDQAFEAVLKGIPKIATRELKRVTEYLRQNLPNAYPQVTFKNALRCDEIDRNIPRGEEATKPSSVDVRGFLFDMGNEDPKPGG